MNEPSETIGCRRTDTSIDNTKELLVRLSGQRWVRIHARFNNIIAGVLEVTYFTKPDAEDWDNAMVRFSPCEWREVRESVG